MSEGAVTFPVESMNSMMGVEMIIDCGTCVVRPGACDDCMVSVLLGLPDDCAFQPDEQAALEVLVGEGMVPPLRLVAMAPTGRTDAACGAA